MNTNRMSRIDEWATIINRVRLIVQDENIPMLAAGFAHYVFTTLVPLILLIVIGLSILDRLALLTRSIELLTNVQGEQFIQLLRVTTNELAVRSRAAILAGTILVWSSFRLFVSVDNAFLIVYDERGGESFLRKMVKTGYALMTIMVAVAMLIGLGIALAFVLKGTNAFLAIVFFFATLIIIFFPMFYFFPGVQLSLSSSSRFSISSRGCSYRPPTLFQGQ